MLGLCFLKSKNAQGFYKTEIKMFALFPPIKHINQSDF